jgi:hypothetical protein
LPVDRNRFERDKAEALNHQQEAMNRAFRVQLAKLLKEKEELQRKCQTLLQQSKEPNGKIHSNGLTNAGAASSQSAAEMLKLIHENSILRIDKKKQEEQLQVNKTTIKIVNFYNGRAHNMCVLVYNLPDIPCARCFLFLKRNRVVVVVFKRFHHFKHFYVC